MGKYIRVLVVVIFFVIIAVWLLKRNPDDSRTDARQLQKECLEKYAELLKDGDVYCEDGWLMLAKPKK